MNTSGRLKHGEKIIVGVNKFQSAEGYNTPIFKINDSIRIVQAEKIRALKARRDDKKVQECLMQINAAAKGITNIMPAVVEAVENFCTLGEIADELRKVFGEYR